MSPRVEDFSPCSACGGKRFPLVLCEACGAASILHNADRLDGAVACPECGSFNPWQLICDQCHSRFPAPDAPPESPAGPAAGGDPPPASEPPGRPKRRLRAELDTKTSFACSSI